jgi:hypothetical protein
VAQPTTAHCNPLRLLDGWVCNRLFIRLLKSGAGSTKWSKILLIRFKWRRSKCASMADQTTHYKASCHGIFLKKGQEKNCEDVLSVAFHIRLNELWLHSFFRRLYRWWARLRTQISCTLGSPQNHSSHQSIKGTVLGKGPENYWNLGVGDYL